MTRSVCRCPYRVYRAAVAALADSVDVCSHGVDGNSFRICARRIA